MMSSTWKSWLDDDARKLLSYFGHDADYLAKSTKTGWDVSFSAVRANPDNNSEVIIELGTKKDGEPAKAEVIVQVHLHWWHQRNRCVCYWSHAFCIVLMCDDVNMIDIWHSSRSEDGKLFIMVPNETLVKGHTYSLEFGKMQWLPLFTVDDAFLAKQQLSKYHITRLIN